MNESKYNQRIYTVYIYNENNFCFVDFSKKNKRVVLFLLSQKKHSCLLICDEKEIYFDLQITNAYIHTWLSYHVIFMRNGRRKWSNKVNKVHNFLLLWLGHASTNIEANPTVSDDPWVVPFNGPTNPQQNTNAYFVLNSSPSRSYLISFLCSSLDSTDKRKTNKPKVKQIFLYLFMKKW